MKYSSVIHDAWDLTLHRPKLKWFVFVPSFAGVLFFAMQVAWQLFTYSSEFGLVKDVSVLGGLKQLVTFLNDNGLLGWSITAAVIVLLFHFIFPSWVFPTVTLSSRSHFQNPEQELLLRQKMIDGFFYFFKIFQYSAVVSPFQFVTVGFAIATTYRFTHGSLFTMLLPFLILYFIAAFIVNVFTAYAPYFIVCEGMKVKKALGKSIGLAFLSLEKTIALMLLMLLVNIRILVNALVVIGVPFAIIGVLSYFASSSFLSIAVALAVIVGVLLVGLAAYLTAIVEVFSTAVWERAFTTLRAEQVMHEDPNVDEDISAE